MRTLIILFSILFSGTTLAGPDLYKVVYKKGDVSMTRQGESRKIFKGDFLISNDLVKTSPNSLVILGFGKDYRSRMKVGPNTKLNLERIFEGIWTSNDISLVSSMFTSVNTANFCQRDYLKSIENIIKAKEGVIQEKIDRATQLV